ncbi:MAG: hypothetical protein JXK07_16820 [Spirochaetes bacterium]|nr:hypothetical protein [Spirochaetota bacterium]MBN2772090.1 hypothetical protein [Spirochaetota bacterium]
MSNAKWFKLFDYLKKEKLFFSSAKIKFLISDDVIRFSFEQLDSEKFDNTGFADFGGGPFKFLEIEWISIPGKYELERKNRQEKLDSKIILQPINKIQKVMDILGQFEYDLDESELKIYGYI